MKRKVYIDYLNISSAYHLIKYEKGSTVIAIFPHGSPLLTKYLVKIVGFFEIDYYLEKKPFYELSENIASVVFDKTINIARIATRRYLYKSITKTDQYFNYIIKRWFYGDLYRNIYIIEYVSRLEEVVNAIYISSSLGKRILEKIILSEYESFKGKIYYYNTSALISDNDYHPQKKIPTIRLLGKNISNLIEVIYNCGTLVSKSEQNIIFLLFIIFGDALQPPFLVI